LDISIYLIRPNIKYKSTQTEENIPYRHPLLKNGVLIKNFPLAQMNSSNGYAITEEISADENGVETKFSGITEIEKKTISSEQRQEMIIEKEKLYGSLVTKKDFDLTSKIGRELTKTIEMVTSSDLVEVVISVSRIPEPTLFAKIEKAIIMGEIATKSDVDRVQKNILLERQFKIENAKFLVLNAIAELKGEVIYDAKNMHFIVANIPANEIQTLAQRNDITRINLNIPLEDEVNGSHIIEAHQIEQFIDNSYNGENSTSSDINFAQLEPNGADDEHVGFNEGSGSSDRIQELYNCSSGSCTSTTSFTSSQESDHASAVAGIIFGDLMDSQDSGVTNSSMRVDRSGYAGESRGWLYRGSDLNIAMDNIAGKTGSTKPAVANMSAGAASMDPDCDGRDTMSIDANEMFENETLLIKSAGNANHPSTSDCTVTAPGSAIGVFTVGSVGSASTTGDATTVRNATISNFSSRGGTTSEGGGRTIIDIAAYGCRTLMFDDTGGYDYSDCGTSFAAPTVTATAIDFIDFYKNTYGSFIDDPGILFVHLLLMGDRQQNSSTKMTSYFNNLYGSGVLKARQFDTFGLDNPYSWSTNSTCIDHNETHTITINSGNTISSDVEAFKAVLWWYDSRHEINGTLDDIDLRLKTTGGTTLRSSVSSTDNKERVFYDVGGLAVKLEISGFNVTSDDSGCGTNSMKVYYAYFYEDSDRDDANGPGSEIETE